MAIFGSLNHMSLSDLLPLLSTRDGALEVFNLERHPRVTLYFRGGRLQCLYLAGRPADPLVARSAISALVSARRGSFEFVPGATPPRCPQPLAWALDHLLLATVTVQDEITALKRQLPHPETIFRRAGNGTPGDERLADFWARAYEPLATGASARALAARLGMPLEQVQYYLLKLRQSGHVQPLRVREPGARGKGLAARLLGSLKRRFFGDGRVWNP